MRRRCTVSAPGTSDRPAAPEGLIDSQVLFPLVVDATAADTVSSRSPFLGSEGSSPCQPVRRTSFTSQACIRVRSMIRLQQRASAAESRSPTAARLTVRALFPEKRPSLNIGCEDAHPDCMKKCSSESDLAGAAFGTATFSDARSLKGRRDEGKSNEDKFFCIQDLFSSTSAPAPPAAIGTVGAFGVFDGHGGASCADFVCGHLPRAIANSPAWARLGSAASEYEGQERTGRLTSTAVKSPVAPASSVRRHHHKGDVLKEVMTEAVLDGFRSTQESFMELARANGDNSGSTAVVSLLCGRQVVIANLGDSEGMFHNENAFVELRGAYTARTKLHNVNNAAEKERVESAGGTFANGRIFGKLEPTRSFGDWDIQRLKEGVLIAVPEVTSHRIQPTTGASFMVLGSDGLWGGVSESKLLSIARTEHARKKKPEKKPLRIAEALAQEAVRGGSGDDVTALVVLFS